MNPHFFTAPFYFAFIWFRVHGSGLKGFKGGGAAYFVILSGEKRSCVKKWLI